MKLFFLLLLAFPLFANNYMFKPVQTATATVTSTMILPQNNLRAYLIIVNTGSQTVYVQFGSAQSGPQGIPIPPGGNYEPYATAPANSVWVDTASSTTTLTFLEGQ